MSPRASRLVALSALWLLGLPSAQAQTIADYSRAQRALLESTMSEAAARSAGLGAPAPAAAASASVSASASASAPAASMPRALVQAPAPDIQVSGVFASSAASLAEIVVNATRYLLQAGQGVPGTTWRVEAIGVDRVVLIRRDPAAGADGQGAVKVFALPSLR